MKATKPRQARIDWGHVLAEAVLIVESYSSGVTLRQLHYRLVAAQLIPNTQTAYKGLSSRTAEARRRGTFPPLVDRVRAIQCAPWWRDPADALEAITRQYRRDRTEGQAHTIFIGIEKAGLLNQFDAWFGHLGIPVIALGGYSSQTFCDEVAEDVRSQGRPAVLLYAGDFDPSGEDIDRDFVERSDCWEHVERVALNADQVLEYDLPPALGKATDSRAQQFVERHGELVQVELDALAPDTLRDLVADALSGWWRTSAYDATISQERQERDALRALQGQVQ